MYLVLRQPLSILGTPRGRSFVQSVLKASKVVLDQVDLQVQHLLCGRGTGLRETLGNGIAALEDYQAIRKRFRGDESQRDGDKGCDTEHCEGGVDGNPVEELS